MPKVLTLLGIGAVVAVATLYLPRLRNSKKVEASADASDVEALFKAAKDPTQTAQFQALFAKTKKFAPRDQSGKPVFAVAAASFHSAATRFLVSTETASLVESQLFSNSDLNGDNVIHLLVRNTTTVNMRDTLAMIKSLLASNTLLCLAMGKAKNVITGKTALIMAVEKCRETPEAVELVKLLVKLHADVDSADCDGITALMTACSHQATTALAIWLLQSTACDCRILDSSNKSALTYATINKMTEAVKIMAERCRPALKSPPSQASLKRRNTSSSVASSTTSLSGIAREAKLNVDPLCIPDDVNGLTPLLWAIKNGFVALADILWTAAASSPSGQKASLKTISCNSLSPLHLAVLSGNLEMVKWVMDNNICLDYSLQDNAGICPFHLAAYLHQPDTLNQFLDSKNQIVDKNRWRAISDYAQTPLHMACISTPLSTDINRIVDSTSVFLKTIQILVQNASPSVLGMFDSNGSTALAYYSQKPVTDSETHEAILKLLTPPAGTAPYSGDIKTPAQRKNLRVSGDLRRRQGLKADVSVDGFSKFLKQITEAKSNGTGSGSGVCVILGERAFPFNADGTQYSGNRVSFPDAFMNPSLFYLNIYKTYASLATTKLPTPLVHSLLLQLESQKILSKAFTTTVEGLLPTLQLNPPPVELYGSLNSPPKCLVCGQTETTKKQAQLQQQQQQSLSYPQQHSEESDKFWTGLLPGFLLSRRISSSSSKPQKIPCPRAGCINGLLAPAIYYKDQNLDTWVSRSPLKGWNTVLKGTETWDAVIVVGADPKEDTIVAKILQSVENRASVPVLVVDSIGEPKSKIESFGVEETARVVEAGEEYRCVRLVVGESEGGVEEGLRILAALAGWKWGLK
ncbi:UNVERIFIED_CONTAM: hypothetical protein HDU68_012487 [Siphonaria sp. JEL0065]|nr:hypothetical protein HDU68_012487 [Siphonaria sp. JEL0065]